ncbi:tRNA (adenosine(37)-N6)-dimethylallyltransferase MiaA [Raineya orbicola]|uniref:tRNA dimethylallyltransferase n=1 Tax=Raineya orbicola TaxID=2016530 RepID=A0A2N3IF55_9BACT|nr:tRNA (adenosine(37)-N6)-dimethylallyltransferase MiaA [Raineya orbicola]PKQ68946.1 miaA: tRNA dimethylallyltransferase [Raineya orbicola]
MQRKFLISVVGATAVGKTEMAIRLAKHFQTEIISADSRQFFKELSIGTAKPTPAEMQGVPHYLVDNLSITQNYTVADFERDALVILDKIFAQKNIAILVGGSGLYCKAIWEGFDDIPDVPANIRKQVIELYEQKGLSFLQAELQKLDEVYFKQVDIQNPQRLMRALEVCYATGKPFSSFRKGKKAQRNFQNIKIGLERPREELYERINQRMDLMLSQGLLQEAQSLYPYKTHNALQTVGYREIFDYLEGKQDWENTIRLLKQNSRHYAKRQMTWFKKDTEIIWFHPSQWVEIVQFVEKRIKETTELQ